MGRAIVGIGDFSCLMAIMKGRRRETPTLTCSRLLGQVLPFVNWRLQAKALIEVQTA